jgi:hypothetical protein
VLSGGNSFVEVHLPHDLYALVLRDLPKVF